MLLMVVAPIVILGLVMTVPIAYRYLWPIKLERPRLFLAITLTLGLIVAGVATFWFFSAFVGVGIAGASARTAASSAALESVLRNRLLVAAVLAALVEYLLCRITQTLMGLWRARPRRSSGRD
jgi:hypothetical protein